MSQPIVMGAPDQILQEPNTGSNLFMVRFPGTNPVPRCGLISGAICGEIMVLIVLINIILIRNYSQAGPGTAGMQALLAWNLVFPLLVIIIFEIGGIFAARICRKKIMGAKPAFLAGFIAGITMGIILEIMWFSNIVSLVIRTGTSGSAFSSGYGGTLMIIVLLLVLVVMGGILSAFGAFIYASRVKASGI